MPGKEKEGEGNESSHALPLCLARNERKGGVSG